MRSLVAVALLLSSTMGCVLEHGSATCGPRPSRTIIGFRVTTETGSNASDMDIQFCSKLRSTGDDHCVDLDTWADNFEEQQTDVFHLTADPIAVGDLEQIKIYNSGGGFLDKKWDLGGLLVDAKLDNGSYVMLYEADIRPNESLERNDSYVPDCTY